MHVQIPERVPAVGVALPAGPAVGPAPRPHVGVGLSGNGLVRILAGEQDQMRWMVRRVV